MKLSTFQLESIVKKIVEESKVIDQTQPDEVEEAVTIRNTISLLHGNFKVVNDFRIGFGAWSVKFRKGQLIRYNAVSKRLTRYNPITKEWDIVSPPIANVNEFDITKYGTTYDQEAAMNTFKSNIDRLTSAELAHEVELVNQSDLKFETIRDFQQWATEKGIRPTQKIGITVSL